MKLTITTGKAEFNKSQFGSSKEVVFVEFPNCISLKTNKSFKWMPTYEQILEILKALGKIEQVSWEK